MLDSILNVYKIFFNHRPISVYKYILLLRKKIRPLLLDFEHFFFVWLWGLEKGWNAIGYQKCEKLTKLKRNTVAYNFSELKNN